MARSPQATGTQRGRTEFSSGIVMGGKESHVAFALLAWLWAHCGLPERSIPFRHEGSDALGLDRPPSSWSALRYAVGAGKE